jgi:uncharacterized membrane protein YfcA
MSLDLGAAQVALWAACAFLFVMGGFVKGTMGVGFPLVVLPTLSLLIPAPQAMGMLVMPVLLSNLFQAMEGGNIGYSLRRFGSLLGVQGVVTLFTVKYSSGLSVENLNLLIAISLLVAVLWMGFKPNLSVPARYEQVACILVGALAGFMGGVSTLTGPFIITLLMALKLTREQFIGSISIIYLAGSLPMYGAMIWYERFGWFEVGLSALGLLPMFAGLQMGKIVRHRLSEETFRKILLFYLLVLALVLAFK